MSISVITRQLRSPITELGVDMAMRHSRHSAKATLLSWCDKAGMRLEDRRQGTGCLTQMQRDRADGVINMYLRRRTSPRSCGTSDDDQ